MRFAAALGCVPGREEYRSESRRDLKPRRSASGRTASDDAGGRVNPDLITTDHVRNYGRDDAIAGCACDVQRRLFAI